MTSTNLPHQLPIFSTVRNGKTEDAKPRIQPPPGLLTPAQRMLNAAADAGLRIAVTNLYRAVLRVDFAYTLSPYRRFDFIIATQQFF